MPNFFHRLPILAALAMPLAGWAQTSGDSGAPENFRCWTVSGGAGYSFVAGSDSASLSGQWNVQAEAGISPLNSAWTKPWSIFFDFDYLYDRASIKPAALAQARNLNPTDIGLLNATGGSSRFNLAALDLTLREKVSPRVELYLIGGFGWFGRQVDLTGVGNQGSLLQPGSPSVFLRNTNSGAFDGGGGINFKKKSKSKGWPMLYLEVRFVRGLAINQSTTLIPFAAGIRW